jgi:hypothetical protein
MILGPEDDAMEYTIARELLSSQQIIDRNDTLLGHLREGKPPVPGQATSLLLALKTLHQHHQHESQLDRELVMLLHQLAWESRLCYERGLQMGVTWSPLLADDLARVAAAVQGIFAGVWPDIHHR